MQVSQPTKNSLNFLSLHYLFLSANSLLFIANFALWMGLYGVGNCAMLYATGYDNLLTEVSSAFFAGFVLDARSGFKMALRRGMSASVFIGVLGLGEMMYSKYRLKKRNDFVNLMTYYQEQVQLNQLKKQDSSKLIHFKS